MTNKVLRTTSVAGQKPGRPQLVGITQVLRLPAGQRHQPRFGLGGDSLCRPRTVVERRDRAVGQGPLNIPLNRLMMQSQRSGDGKERWIFAVTQQYTGSFNPGSPVLSATAQSTSASPHPHR
jgi:hypothetical protein